MERGCNEAYGQAAHRVCTKVERRPDAPDKEHVVADPTAREFEAIDQSNASGRTPVLFVHGLWLLPSSWDRWRTVFEDAGYATLAPGWPDDPDTVEEANAHPDVFAHKTVGQIADHFEDVIRKLNTRPAIVGHSFGGLLTQILAGRGVSAARRRRPGALPRRPAPPHLRPQVGGTRAPQSRQPGPGRPPHLRAVPLRVRQRRERGRSQGAVRDLRGAGFGGPHI